MLANRIFAGLWLLFVALDCYFWFIGNPASWFDVIFMDLVVALSYAFPKKFGPASRAEAR